MKLLLSLCVSLSLVASLPSNDSHRLTHPYDEDIPLRAPEYLGYGPHTGFHLNRNRFWERNNAAPILPPNMPPLMTTEYPRIDENQCSRNTRCRLPTSSRTHGSLLTPQATIIHKIVAPPQPDNQGKPAALTGPQLTSSSHLTSTVKATHNGTEINILTNPATPKCPLNLCTSSNICGPAAICTQGFCACPPGRTGLGIARKGWLWSGAERVFVQPGVACSMPCDSHSCSEYQFAMGCPGLESKVPGGKLIGVSGVLRQSVKEKGKEGKDEKQIGSSEMEGSYYVDGVALPSSVRVNV